MQLTSRPVRHALAAAVLAAAASALATVPAEAATPTTPAPSACRPADHRATLRPDSGRPEENHYRVTLTAAPGTAPCTLDGAPTDLAFTVRGRPVSVITGRPVAPGTGPVTFGPGRPVHFELVVADHQETGTRADEVTFTLPGVPGQSAATGLIDITGQVHADPIAPGA